MRKVCFFTETHLPHNQNSSIYAFLILSNVSLWGQNYYFTRRSKELFWLKNFNILFYLPFWQQTAFISATPHHFLTHNYTDVYEWNKFIEKPLLGVCDLYVPKKIYLP